MKHFLKETDFAPHEVADIFAMAESFKRLRNGSTPPTLDRQSWGMLFFKNSTRTRTSFEVGIHELGGHPLVMDAQTTQLNRGESIEDSAKVFSRYLHGLVIRTYDHNDLVRFSQSGTIPIVNALTDFLHPCQIYTDAFTMAERWATGNNYFESLKGRKIAFLGDTACNMANSWILGAQHFGMEISLAGPKGFEPSAEFIQFLADQNLSTDSFTFTTDPVEAVKDADVVYTDVWISMGMEDEAKKREELMKPYSVTSELMSHAKDDAYFMHCLPAHPGHEVSQEVLDSPQSIIFDQAENRLHVQKAILSALVEANRQG